ncbi:MAG: hypothetical protein ACLSGS_01680 [Adlercreutzia sp.]
MKALKRAGMAAKTFASIVLAGSLVGTDWSAVPASWRAMRPDATTIVLTVSKCQTKELPQELLDEMTNRHPNLRFEFDTYSNSNYSAQIVTELEQRDIPDILINTRNQDLTEDLSIICGSRGVRFFQRVPSSVLDRMTIDGSLYYLPGYLTLAGFFYNKDLFAGTAGRPRRSRNHCPQRAGEGGGHLAYGVLDGADGSAPPAADQYRFGAVSAHAAGRLGNRIILRAKRAWWARSSLSWTSIGFA